MIQMLHQLPISISKNPYLHFLSHQIGRVQYLVAINPTARLPGRGLGVEFRHSADDPSLTLGRIIAALRTTVSRNRIGAGVRGGFPNLGGAF